MTEDHTNTPRLGAGRVMTAMGFAVLALAFASIFITELERSAVPPLVIAFYRMAIATALTLPVALAFKWREIATLARKDLGLMVLGGFCLAVHFGAWITSLKYVPIATSIVLVNSHPLFVVIASYFFLGERPARRGLIGIGIGLVGMAVMSHDALGSVQLAMKGDGLALLGALAVVGYFIVGRKARARISLLGYVTPLYAVCSLFLLIWVLMAGNRLAPYGAEVWAYLGALAVVPTVIGHTVFNWALKHVRPTAISLAFLGEPVIASVLALIFFAQRPPLATFVGGALVLAGVYLTTSRAHTEPSEGP
ncbi:MAG TPA: DMT family transporter [Blastocatellia bacterium]|nr:DMT family transporter [Blastocatellia bacterium]